MLCSIGDYLTETCSGVLTDVRKLTDQQVFYLKKRSGCVRLTKVCVLHRQNYLEGYFVFIGRKCCNPFNEANHKGKDIKSITDTQYFRWQFLTDFHTSIAPGKKICFECRERLHVEVTRMPVLSPRPSNSSPSTSGTGPQSNPSYPPVLRPECEDMFCNSPEKEQQFSQGSSGACVSSPSSNIYTSQSVSSQGSTSKQDFWCTPEQDRSYSIVCQVASALGLSFPEQNQLHRNALFSQFCFDMLSKLKTEIFTAASRSTEITEDVVKVLPIDYEETCKEIFLQIKKKLETCSLKERLHLLSVTPQTWTVRHVMEEFGVSRRAVCTMKTLVLQQGILPDPLPRQASTQLDQSVMESVKNFYYDAEVSRELPGKRDVVSVRGADGTRELKQKRLFLCNLKEGFKLFKQENPDIQIGFSKFASLRPREVVLAGAAGTHSVCVCTIHQNVKLAISGTNLNCLSDVQDDSESTLTYADYLLKTMCSNPSSDCKLRNCKSCPGVESIREELELIFDERMVDTVSYSQWIATDRSSLESLVKPVEDFINGFIHQLHGLAVHDFIAKCQAKFLKDVKARLKADEVIVTCDFSENYAFVLQDAAQGFHWNNEQATLHPFVCYSRNESSDDLKVFSLIVISDCLKHDTRAVYAFQKVLIPFLKSKLTTIAKLYYFSDGSAAQYKNRFNISNLMYHEEDFGIIAEWNYFATAHGKGPSDGLGGTLKRNATRSSMQGLLIRTPLELYDYATRNLPNINFSFVTKEAVDETALLLQDRYESAKAVPNIMQIHRVVPTGNFKVILYRESFGSSLTTVDLAPRNKQMSHSNSQGSAMSKSYQMSPSLSSRMGRSGQSPAGRIPGQHEQIPSASVEGSDSTRQSVKDITGLRRSKRTAMKRRQEEKEQV